MEREKSFAKKKKGLWGKAVTGRTSGIGEGEGERTSEGRGKEWREGEVEA